MTQQIYNPNPGFSNPHIKDFDEYLTKINEAYSRFFLDYEKAPVLIVNAADINFEENEEDYEMLVTKIMSNPKGKTFINPQPSIL